MSRTHRLKPRLIPAPLLPSVKPAPKKQPRRPLYRRPLLFLLLVLLVSLFLLRRFTTHTTPLRTTTTAPPASPVLPRSTPRLPALSRVADRCYIIGSDPNRHSAFTLNSRSLCVASNLCLSRPAPHDLYIRAGNRSTECGVLSTGLADAGPVATDRAVNDFGGCHQLQQRLVTCAHGDGLGMNRGECPEERTVRMADVEHAVWHDGVTIVVPEYPFEANIYHFANIVAWAAYIKHRVGDLVGEEVGRVRMLFKGPASRQEWQRGLMKAVLGGDVEYMSGGEEDREEEQVGEEEEEGWSCMRKAVVLGLRGHVNVWPYGNDSAVPTDGRSVPAEAVRVREAVYAAASVTDVFDGERLRLPPLRLGYARRVGAADLEAGNLGANVAVRGTERRFSDEEEEWFVGMLREECERGGVDFGAFTTRDEGFEEQVRNIAQYGVVAGIHGANLVNGMFVRPFGGVIEVVPAGVGSLCYVGGMNSGLAYWRIEGEGGELQCDRREIECRLRLRQRVVGIGTQKERLRASVREAVGHLNELWRRFPGGSAPVTRDDVEDRWHIDYAADE